MQHASSKSASRNKQVETEHIYNIAVDTVINVSLTHFIIYWILLLLIHSDVYFTTQFPRLLSHSFSQPAAKLLLASVPSPRPNLDFPIIC